MKKFLTFIFAAALMMGMTACKKTSEQPAEVAQGNTTVEELTKQDAKYFDNMAGKNIFYESRVVLDKPFNEADKFVAIEITNVFQQNLKDDDLTTCNVYEFKHIINYGDVDVQEHKGTFVVEDIAVNPDSLKLTFEQAFDRAKQSDLVPSKSRFMTLRHPLGPSKCNPQYIIGTEKTGMMFIDAMTGDVSEKNPAFPGK